MRINYKILWIDDEPDDFEVKKDLLYNIVKKHQMIPIGMDTPFKSFNSFKNEMIDRYTPNKFLDFDLILIDYNLSEESDDKFQTGEELIKLLREKGVYTDVLFYSSNMSGYREKKIYSELDNVVFSDSSTNEIQKKFENILIKQENLSMGIQNIRGYLMDSTSDFDFIMRNSVEKLYFQLAENDRKTILNKIQTYIDKQKNSEKNKFIKTENKYGKDKLIKDAMSSLDYVMSVQNKSYIFAMIIYYLGMVDKKNVKVEEFATMFSNEYYDKIICKRNKMAHNKLNYGDRDRSHIKIIKNIEDIKCNCDICHQDDIITLDKCKTLKEDIFNYYIFLDDIFSKVLEKIDSN